MTSLVHTQKNNNDVVTIRVRKSKKNHNSDNFLV